ncbi:Inositol phosphatase [Penicillium chermesinum]|nr:Inositol phosphatase [Penicillium chermesinum]
MPGLLRKLVIVAAADGLILHAHGANGTRYNGSNNEASSIQIDYKSKKISAVPTSTFQSLETHNALESWGLREQVAQIQGRPVYAVANVAVIPVSSQADALRAITQARNEVSQSDSDAVSEPDEENPDNVTDAAETEIGSVPASPERDRDARHARNTSVSSIAEDVIEKRVRFGRFAANWLSRKNLGLPRPGALSQNPPDSPFDESPALSREDPPGWRCGRGCGEGGCEE